MADRLTVLIMAAGKGTRMRSVAAQGAASGVRQADGGVGDRRRPRRRRRPRSCPSPAPATAWPRACPTTSTVAEQREGEGTGAAVLAARDAVDGGTVVVLSGDVPLQSAELIGELVATHREQGAAATLLTTEQLDPTGLRAHRPRRRRLGRADRGDQAPRRRAAGGAGHPRDQHRHLRLRRRGAVRRAGPGGRPSTASIYLTGVLPGAARAGPDAWSRT